MKKEKVVFTSGSWDLFHVGHLNVLRRSRELGDRLIVGVSTDELIAEYKGAPPVIPFEERLEIVQNVKGVDLAVRQTILTEIRQLQEYNVDIVTIGRSNPSPQSERCVPSDAIVEFWFVVLKLPNVIIGRIEWPRVQIVSGRGASPGGVARGSLIRPPSGSREGGGCRAAGGPRRPPPGR